MALIARLLNGTGIRLMEGLRLRVKDVDFDRHVIIVREAKGNKDRLVMLPRSLAVSLKQQIAASRALWEADRRNGVPGVETPNALEVKYPNVGKTWRWYWVFPSPTLSVDPRSGIRRRHHLYEERSQRALSWRLPKQELKSVSQAIRCGIHLRRICFSRAQTYARCRNCWITAMSAQP